MRASVTVAMALSSATKRARVTSPAPPASSPLRCPLAAMCRCMCAATAGAMRVMSSHNVLGRLYGAVRTPSGARGAAAPPRQASRCKARALLPS